MNNKYLEQEQDSIKQYKKEIEKYDVLSFEEEQSLFKKYNSNIDEKTKKDIRDEIVLKNQRLIFFIANRYYNSLSSALSFLDLISEGNLGLFYAIDKFDYTLGNKFSTYSTYWIEKYIRYAILNKRDAIRIPIAVKQTYIKINKYIDEYYNLHQQQPSNYDIVLNVKDIDIDTVKEYYDYKNKLWNISSINNYIYNDNEDEIIDGMSDNNSINNNATSDKGDLENLIIDRITDENFYDDLEYILKKGVESKEISEREMEVFSRRFNLNNEDKSNITPTYVVAKEFKISNERVRLIESKVFKFLRHPKNATILNSYDIF